MDLSRKYYVIMENLRWKSSCNKLEALGCGDEAKLTDEDYENVMSIVFMRIYSP